MVVEASVSSGFWSFEDSSLEEDSSFLEVSVVVVESLGTCSSPGKVVPPVVVSWPEVCSLRLEDELTVIMGRKGCLVR